MCGGFEVLSTRQTQLTNTHIQFRVCGSFEVLSSCQTQQWTNTHIQFIVRGSFEVLSSCQTQQWTNTHTYSSECVVVLRCYQLVKPSGPTHTYSSECVVVLRCYQVVKPSSGPTHTYNSECVVVLRCYQVVKPSSGPTHTHIWLQVVQVYLAWTTDVVPMPRWTLVGFSRVTVALRHSQWQQFVITPRQMSVWLNDTVGYHILQGACIAYFKRKLK